MTGRETRSWKAAGELAASFKRPLLLSHTRPDCDAFGSLIALRVLLGEAGADPIALAFDPIPRTYEFLKARFPTISVWQHDFFEADLGGVDGIIIADTCTYNQLTPLESWLRTSTLPKIVIDHHATRDALADHYLTDESAAAACLLIYEWARLMNWSLDDDAAAALFLGIATDTGWFAHSNTNGRALAAAAELASSGINPNDYHVMIHQTDTIARVRLLTVALNSLELFAEDRLAVMTLELDTFKRLEVRPSETENMINEPLRIRSVVVSILVIEEPDGLIRVSFRSKAPIASYCELDIDVARLAGDFGGGGHRRASGARVEGSLQEVRRKVVEHVAQRL